MRFVLYSVLGLLFFTSASLGEDASFGTMEEFRKTIRVVANGVVKVLKSRHEDSISIGSFSGPPNLGTAAGPGIKQLFIEELKESNIRVAKLGTPLGLSGEYRLAKQNPNSETKQVQLEIKLTDDSGQAVADLASMIEFPEWRPEPIPPDDNDRGKGKVIVDTFSSPEATALAMGLTVDFDELHRRRLGEGNGSFNPAPIDIIKESTDSSTAFILNGNELRASRSSPYGLQVLVNGMPRSISLEAGRPFVALTKGDIFKLRFSNQASLGVSSVFTLDGINSFSFSEIRKDNGKPKYSQYILKPRNSTEIAGWHLNNTAAKEFKITDFSESAAALLASDGQIGTLAVVVRATWTRNEKPPADEELKPGAALLGGSIGAVGFGREVEQRVNEDAQAREYGRVRSILTIRYEKE